MFAGTPCSLSPAGCLPAVAQVAVSLAHDGIAPLAVPQQLISIRRNAGAGKLVKRMICDINALFLVRLDVNSYFSVARRRYWDT